MPTSLAMAGPDLGHFFGRVEGAGLHPDLVIADRIDGRFVKIGNA
jgi:hypothetical protein